MNGSIIEAARTEVRNRFGEALESKASDQLIIKLAGLAVVGAEAVIPTQGAILEFEPPDLPAAATAARAEIEAIPAWADFQEGIAGAAPEVRRQSSSRALVRSQLVQAAKDGFRKKTRPVRDTLDRATESEAELTGFEATGATQGIALTCWLNGTIRTASTSPALAEVAADEQIKGLDVPRKLTLEVSATTNVVGAPSFRQQHGLTGQGIIVAVIDTEVAIAHPAFGGRAENKANFARQPLGNPASHGTAVAGIVASEDPTFTGIAPGATIWAYKIFPAASDFEGALAIQQALEDGAHIANCSWGTGPASDGTSREAVACNNAWALGLTIFKSAGNGGPNSQTLTTPADADGIIVVGATNRDGDRVEDYSSRGPTSDNRHRPHLAAPGGDESVKGITSANPMGGFADAGWGTSYAAPHVAGLAALLLESNPSFGPDDLRDALLASCTPVPGFAVDDIGAGLVNFQ